LNTACSQYMISPIQGEITQQFTAPPTTYSISDFTEFVLQHRLR
jgi:hypothetical protein